MKIFTLLISLMLATSATAATFTITIPDDKLVAIIDAFAEEHKYNGFDENGDPITKVQFSKQKVREFITNGYKAQKIKTGLETARQTIITNADTDTSGVTVE